MTSMSKLSNHPQTTNPTMKCSSKLSHGKTRYNSNHVQQAAKCRTRMMVRIRYYATTVYTSVYHGYIHRVTMITSCAWLRFLSAAYVTQGSLCAEKKMYIFTSVRAAFIIFICYNMIFSSYNISFLQLGELSNLRLPLNLRYVLTRF